MEDRKISYSLHPACTVNNITAGDAMSQGISSRCVSFYVQIATPRYNLFFCLRLRKWPVTHLITLSDWIMSCQPGRHAVVTVCEPDWKHKWAAYKSFDETSSFNNL